MQPWWAEDHFEQWCLYSRNNKCGNYSTLVQIVVSTVKFLWVFLLLLINNLLSFPHSETESRWLQSAVIWYNKHIKTASRETDNDLSFMHWQQTDRGMFWTLLQVFPHSLSPPHVNICTPKRLNTSRFEKDSVSPPIAKEPNNWEKDPSLASSLLIPQALFVQYQQPRAQVSAEE